MSAEAEIRPHVVTVQTTYRTITFSGATFTTAATPRGMLQVCFISSPDIKLRAAGGRYAKFKLPDNLTYFIRRLQLVLIFEET